jgi:hypothetical protein
MFKRNVISLAVLTTLVATTAAAANKKDDQEDSVSSWGPWNGVQTAAGPGGAATVPLLIQFADLQGNTDGSAFDAGVEDDNSGYREYMAWYSRKAHDKRNSTERAYFSERPVPVDGGEGATTVDYAIATEAGDQTHNPRTAKLNRSGAFVSFDYKNKKNRNKQYIYTNAVTQNGKDIGSRAEADLAEIAYFSGNWYGKDEVKQKGQWKQSQLNNRGDFVFGQSSSIASVNNLLAGNATAVYQSKSAFAKGGYVRIELELGAGASWSGYFNPNGKNNHSFTVQNGTFNGVDLAGVVASKGATGTVDASFFGSQAQHIAGIAEVDFGKKAGQFVDVFAVQQTCLGACSD